MIKGEAALFHVLIILDNLGVVRYWSKVKTLGYDKRMEYVERRLKRKVVGL